MGAAHASSGSMCKRESLKHVPLVETPYRLSRTISLSCVCSCFLEEVAGETLVSVQYKVLDHDSNSQVKVIVKVRKDPHAS
jgi:hypothetical protein